MIASMENNAELLQPLNQLLQEAEAMRSLFLFGNPLVYRAPEIKTEAELQASEQRVQHLLNQMSVFEKNMASVITPEFMTQLNANHLSNDAQKLIDQLHQCNQSLLDAANRECDHLASELRQQVISNKALDAYRR